MSSNDNKKKRSEKDDVADTPITGKRVHRRSGDIHEQEESSNIWLVSFTDVMALMLTFFVLLFSMTEPEKQDWSMVTSALQSEFNRFYGAMENRGHHDSVSINKVDFDQALNISYLEALMETVVEDSKFLGQVSLIRQPGQLIISMPRDLLFDPGSASVKEQGARALYALGGTLWRIKNKIEVVGHADPRPVRHSGAAGFDSNWELSMARAASVAAILESVGYDRDITIRGHSSGRYDELKGLVDEQKRLNLARRVDIVIMDHDGVKRKVLFSPAFD